MRYIAFALMICSLLFGASIKIETKMDEFGIAINFIVFLSGIYLLIKSNEQSSHKN